MALIRLDTGCSSSDFSESEWQIATTGGSLESKGSSRDDLNINQNLKRHKISSVFKYDSGESSKTKLSASTIAKIVEWGVNSSNSNINISKKGYIFSWIQEQIKVFKIRN